MFQKEPLNPITIIGILKNKDEKTLYLLTRVNPPSNVVFFSRDIGPYNGKPLKTVLLK
jgi:hypothetical protein